MSIQTDLPTLLAGVTRPGDFATHGRLEAFPPSLEVIKVGRIALPLQAAQAAQLTAVAERAPYGKRGETLVDESVRKTWQIGAERVRLGGRHWPSTLSTITARVVSALGVTGTVNAELYKLLLYDAGSFFVSHRDTEKAPGMFATLVVVLPSACQGGELRVQHAGRSMDIDLRTVDPAEIAFAAFFADCLHEVRPVTEGCRLTLVYNLIRSEPGPPLRPAEYSAESRAVAARLGAWVAGTEWPRRLVLPLAHAYTPAELTVAKLKGRDAAVAQVLFEAGATAQCEVSLALASVEEQGSAEYDGWGRRATHEFEIQEVCSREASLSQWRTADGATRTLGSMSFEDEEICPPDAFEALAEASLSFSEATGNEGASFERSYQLGAMVLWPRAEAMRIVGLAGPKVAVAYLVELVDGAEVESGATRTHSLAQARALATSIVESWPQSRPWVSAALSGEFTTLLDVLGQLGADDLLTRCLAEIAGKGTYSGGENEAIVAAAFRFPPKRRAALLAQIIAANVARVPADVAALFLRFARAYVVATDVQDVDAVRRAMVAGLATLPDRRAYDRGWLPIIDTVVYAVTGLSLLGPDDADGNRDLGDALAASPDRFPVDQVLVPAVLRLMKAAETAGSLLVEVLRNHCLEHIRIRVGVTPAPPRDWTRTNPNRCPCPNCTEFSRFLAHPGVDVWRLKAAKARRDHVVQYSRGADVSFETTADSSPHTLVCRKNQNSYERRVKERIGDLETLAALGAGA